MNHDEQFENRLRRQSPRTLPPEWRGEILAAANAARQTAAPPPRGAETAAAVVAGWRLLFARLPLAWAAVIALWAGMIGVNLTMPGPLVRVTLQAPAAAHGGAMAAMDSTLTGFDADGDSAAPTPALNPAQPGSAVPPRPRSEHQPGLRLNRGHLNGVAEQSQGGSRGLPSTVGGSEVSRRGATLERQPSALQASLSDRAETARHEPASARPAAFAFPLNT